MTKIFVNNITDGVIVDLEMFDIGIVGIIRGESGCSIIVVVKGCTSKRGKTKTFEKFIEKNKFFTSIMESNILGVAREIHSMLLLLEALGNDTSAK